MEMQQARTQERTKVVKDASIYINRATRDRINMFKARFSSPVGRILTQDETLAIVFDAWDAHHDDSDAAQFASGGPRQ